MNKGSIFIVSIIVVNDKKNTNYLRFVISPNTKRDVEFS